MTEGVLAPAFIAGARGRILVLLRYPRGVAQGPSVLFVVPLAEEMNKCRRMLTLTAQRLQARGIGSVIVDLYGTGDSEGEFAEADADVWLSDLEAASEWAAARQWPIAAAVCVRGGCLLGAHFAKRRELKLRSTVFWQAATHGERLVTQLLRLRVAAAAMKSGGERETVTQLRNRLATGENIEVAGYELSGALVRQLDALELRSGLGRHLGKLHWMEVVRDPQQELPAPASACVTAQRESAAVEIHRFVGEPYWSSTEIVVNEALIDATVDALTVINSAATRDRNDGAP